MSKRIGVFKRKYVRWKGPITMTLLACNLFGCSYSQQYVASIPDVQGTAVSLKEQSVQQKKHHIMKLDDLEFSVKPFNARLVSRVNFWVLFIPIPFHRMHPDEERFGMNENSAAPPFLIEFAFHPLEGELKMDPSQVTLHLEGRDYKPTQMVLTESFIPLKSFGGRYSQALGLCFRPNEFQIREMLKPLQPIRISMGEKACTWLSFDIAPPPPETEFSISIKGIEMAGKEIEIPKLRFVKGTAHLFDKIP